MTICNAGEHTLMCVCVCVWMCVCVCARACIKHIHIPNPQARVHAHRRKWYTRMIGPFALSAVWMCTSAQGFRPDALLLLQAIHAPYMQLCSCSSLPTGLESFLQKSRTVFLERFWKKIFPGMPSFPLVKLHQSTWHQIGGFRFRFLPTRVSSIVDRWW